MGRMGQIAQTGQVQGAVARDGTRLPEDPMWPATPGRRVVFLVDASSGLEARLIEDWIARTRPEGAASDSILIPASRRRRRRNPIDTRLEDCVATEDETLLAPVRVAWLAPQRGGVRSAGISDLFTLGDPRDPGRLRQSFILRRNPDRCRIVAGDPAPVSELRARWRSAGGAESGETTGLAVFVCRQATLALERAERRLRGARYKVPRFVHEDILALPSFRGGMAHLARELGRQPAHVSRDAARYLREIAATHSTYVIDLAAHLIRWLYTRGYREQINYDGDELRGIYALAQRHPVVFLPSHKSNLDHLVLQYVLHENGHPPNHTAGGINMNFFPIGPLVRRSGTFFIRRTFRDNPVYKFVLSNYIDYLIGKRFSLEWYIEGGRSRSGKLLPPRFGLLASVVDSYRRAKSDDVYLIPVSIAYDQISDVGDYVAEQRGGKKQTESFRWFVGIVRRMKRRYGEIHIRFGEPISLRKSLGPPPPEAEPNPDESSLDLQKLAFEVAVRINRSTPITPNSLATLALLEVGDRALSVREVRESLDPFIDYVRRRGLPTTFPLEQLGSSQGITAVLDTLVEGGVVECFAEGPEAVYAIRTEQHLAAAYYRNSILHFFLDATIGELALLRAAENDVAHPEVEFWDEAMRLRDLLKFDFFFSEKDEFKGQLRREIAMQDPEWEKRLTSSREDIQALIRSLRPFAAHRMIRPFLEAYRVVADALEQSDPAVPVGKAAFVNECLALGKQYRLQRRIQSSESVSQVLFATAYRLAGNRGLLDEQRPDLAAARSQFADEIRQVIRRIDVIDALAAARRAGLFD